MGDWMDRAAEKVLNEDCLVLLADNLILNETGNPLLLKLVSERCITRQEMEVVCNSGFINCKRVDQLITFLSSRLETSVFVKFVEYVGDPNIGNNQPLKREMMRFYEERGGNMSAFEAPPADIPSILVPVLSEPEQGGDDAATCRTVDCLHDVRSLSGRCDERDNLFWLNNHPEIESFRFSVSNSPRDQSSPTPLPDSARDLDVLSYLDGCFLLVWKSTKEYSIIKKTSAPRQCVKRKFGGSPAELLTVDVRCIISQSFVVVIDHAGTVFVYGLNEDKSALIKVFSSNLAMSSLQGACTYSSDDDVHIYLALWTRDSIISGKLSFNDHSVSIERKGPWPISNVKNCTFVNLLTSYERGTKTNSYFLVAMYQNHNRGMELKFYGMDDNSRIASSVPLLLSEGFQNDRILFSGYRNDTLIIVGSRTCVVMYIANFSNGTFTTNERFINLHHDDRPQDMKIVPAHSRVYIIASFRIKVIVSLIDV